MSSDNQRALKDILRRVEKLGCTVKPTSKGYMIRSRTGQVAVHRSSSDFRATTKIIHDLRKIGINLYAADTDNRTDLR